MSESEWLHKNLRSEEDLPLGRMGGEGKLAGEGGSVGGVERRRRDCVGCSPGNG